MLPSGAFYQRCREAVNPQRGTFRKTGLGWVASFPKPLPCLVPRGLSLAAKVVGAQGRKGRGKPLSFLFPVIPRVLVPNFSCWARLLATEIEAPEEAAAFWPWFFSQGGRILVSFSFCIYLMVIINWNSAHKTLKKNLPNLQLYCMTMLLQRANEFEIVLLEPVKTYEDL